MMEKLKAYELITIIVSYFIRYHLLEKKKSITLLNC
jgi:hypothetical protein